MVGAVIYSQITQVPKAMLYWTVRSIEWGPGDKHCARTSPMFENVCGCMKMGQDCSILDDLSTQAWCGFLKKATVFGAAWEAWTIFGNLSIIRTRDHNIMVTFKVIVPFPMNFLNDG